MHIETATKIIGYHVSREDVLAISKRTSKTEHPNTIRAAKELLKDWPKYLAEHQALRVRQLLDLANAM